MNLENYNVRTVDLFPLYSENVLQKWKVDNQEEMSIRLSLDLVPLSVYLLHTGIPRVRPIWYVEPRSV